MGTLFRFPAPVGHTIVPGGPAGSHSPVSGLQANDTLITVKHVSADLVTNADLTGEFSVTGAGEIDNTLGTDTTGDFLIVSWKQPG